MGTVYRATDTKLNRDVAVKVLPETFAKDPDRMARFESEAQVLASLNHPGVAHLYGFEAAALPEGGSAHFLVMELVEGEDLAQRLSRGAIPVADTASRLASSSSSSLTTSGRPPVISMPSTTARQS